MKLAGRLAIGLGAVNLATLALVAAVSAKDGSWGKGEQALPPDALPVSEVARALEAAGVERIYRIEADGKAYQVRGLDSAGHRIELKVDPVNGSVLSE